MIRLIIHRQNNSLLILFFFWFVSFVSLFHLYSATSLSLSKFLLYSPVCTYITVLDLPIPAFHLAIVAPLFYDLPFHYPTFHSNFFYLSLHSHISTTHSFTISLFYSSFSLWFLCSSNIHLNSLSPRLLHLPACTSVSLLISNKIFHQLLSLSRPQTTSLTAYKPHATTFYKHTNNYEPSCLTNRSKGDSRVKQPL